MYRFVGVLYYHGYRRTRELLHEFSTLDTCRPIGLAPLLGAAEKPDKSYMYDRLSGSALIDPVLEEVLCVAAQHTYVAADHQTRTARLCVRVVLDTHK
jgi:hypothetical protein